MRFKVNELNKCDISPCNFTSSVVYWEPDYNNWFINSMADYSKLYVGVLALQGDFERHSYQLSLLGAKPVEVRVASQLDVIDGLIIPGGESTTMDILIDRFGLREPLIKFGQGMPLWGTCAGMIMIAKNIVNNQAGVKPLGLMDIDVDRNFYGRQLYSFEDKIIARLDNKDEELTATFIRAPGVSRVGENVEILARHSDKPILLKQANLLASSFHTELDEDTRLMAYFLQNFLMKK